MKQMTILMPRKSTPNLAPGRSGHAERESEVECPEFQKQIVNTFVDIHTTVGSAHCSWVHNKGQYKIIDWRGGNNLI